MVNQSTPSLVIFNAPISVFSLPNGGMAMWININKPVHNLKQALQSQGIYIQVEPEFYFKEAKRSLMPSQQCSMRLGFAGQSTQAMQTGLELIVKHVYPSI